MVNHCILLCLVVIAAVLSNATSIPTAELLSSVNSNISPGIANQISYRIWTEHWLEEVNDLLKELTHKRTELMWQLQTNLTKEAEHQLIQFQKLQSNVNNIICAQHSKIDTSILTNVQRRMMKRLCHGISLSEPDTKELIDVKTKLQSIYSGASVLMNHRTYRGESEVKQLMTQTANISMLLNIWLDWRKAIGPRAKPLFIRLINLENKGARVAGYKDISELWKGELEVDNNLDFVVDALFNEIKPLYTELYAFVRGKLAEWDSSGTVKPDRPLPAHVLGNMWAQSWEALLPMLLANTSYEDKILQRNVLAKQWTSIKDMARLSESFFTSLGFPPLPISFWTKSQFTQPTDGRKVVCHASATNFYKNRDVRLMMCGKRTEEDFYTLHHEMGHIYYFLSYRHQPFLFQTGANSAFHEAIGDTIVYAAMSANHQMRVGLSQKSDANDQKNAGFVRLLHLALMKIPLLPYSIALEKWRWGVMSGLIKPSNYNKAWWDLKLKYQGIIPPLPRSEEDFDPAGKFHVVSNVPYIRYFLSAILQVQFFDALCDATQQGPRFGKPLNECDIYGSKEAGDLLRRMMALGGSKPWNYALGILTNGKSTTLSAKPLIQYYDPLFKWLVQENRRRNYTVSLN